MVQGRGGRGWGCCISSSMCVISQPLEGLLKKVDENVKRVTRLFYNCKGAFPRGHFFVRGRGLEFLG